MKRLLSVPVLIITILAGGALAYSIWKSSNLTSKQFFESGKHYYEQEKYPQATIQFLNALKKDARNRDARYFLALCYIKQQNFNAAAKQLVVLLEYFPDDVEANLKLGTLYLAAGPTDGRYFGLAAEIAQKILAK